MSVVFYVLEKKMDDSYIRVFQNCIKAVFSLYADDSSLQKIDCDFKAVKCIFDH